MWQQTKHTYATFLVHRYFVNSFHEFHNCSRAVWLTWIFKMTLYLYYKHLCDLVAKTSLTDFEYSRLQAMSVRRLRKSVIQLINYRTIPKHMDIKITSFEVIKFDAIYSYYIEICFHFILNNFLSYSIKIMKYQLFLLCHSFVVPIHTTGSYMYSSSWGSMVPWPSLYRQHAYII